MKQIEINKNDFYTQYAVYNEYGRLMAILNVTNDSKDCYKVEMMEKAPIDLLSVYDFIRANWR